MYKTLRTLHLIFGLFSLPFLLVYGLSAVQMAHPKWFNTKPAIHDADVPVARGYTDGRSVARQLMANGEIRGEITSVQETALGFTIRSALPGTVHDIKYDRKTGTVHIRTSVAGFMGRLNRLHHAAGLWHEYLPLKFWAIFVGLVSLATVGLGLTGIVMWWMRRQDRTLGLILLGANLACSLTILSLLRSAGP
jgi:hypothetical protein